MKTKLFGLLAVAAMSLFALAGTASATITPGPPAALSAHSDDVELVGFISCESDLSGHVTYSNGTGLGGGGKITDGSFYNCGFGNSATDYLDPGDSSTWWDIDAVPLGGGLSKVTVSNIKVSVTVGFLVTCTYAGALEGVGNNTDDTITLQNVGGLTLQSGSALCPSAPSVSATYLFDQDVEVS